MSVLAGIRYVGRETEEGVCFVGSGIFVAWLGAVEGRRRVEGGGDCGGRRWRWRWR